MKYIIVLADGASDYPVGELGGRTPLEAANKLYMDFLARRGELFLVKTIPDSLAPGSDVANLSVMGYDPTKYYTGRSPLEAASIGVKLDENDTTFRCNLVTLSDDEDYENKTMIDYSSDEISTEEARKLIEAINEAFGREGLKFYSGVSYRHLLVWSGAEREFNLTPPHDISGRKIADYLPDCDVLREMMVKSYEVLKNHPVNTERAKRGKHCANSIWIWGEGKKPLLPSFKELYSLDGSVVAAVDLVKGIGICAGLRCVKVEGATGNINTNFEGKAKAAVAELEAGQDFVYIHIEAPDECGHRGEALNKVRAIELIDEKIIKYIIEEMDKKGLEYSFMLLPDHPTPLSIKTHARDSVPCVIYRSGSEMNANRRFTERDAAREQVLIDPGHTLMQKFLSR